MIPLSEILNRMPTTRSDLAIGFVMSDRSDRRTKIPDSALPRQSEATGQATSNKESFQGGIAFRSESMRQLVRLATRYAVSSAAVMVSGPSGTGKELFSRLIHDESRRRDAPFVAVNCAAIPEALLESELFGHERGAFTGAVSKRIGYFERADQGTLFLDEISEIPIQLQAKLLRAIEEGEVQPVGGNQPRRVDVRIIATSNRDLLKEISLGTFRRDLFHRLNVLEVKIPALRNRVADIPLLAMHFVEMFRHESLDGIKEISKEAMQRLCEYDWPGNVRELRNVIHRACVVCRSTEISLDALPALNESDMDKSMFDMSLAEVEKKLIEASLSKFKGNKKSAAALLGVTPRTLSNKLKQYENETFDV